MSAAGFTEILICRRPPVGADADYTASGREKTAHLPAEQAEHRSLSLSRRDIIGFLKEASAAAINDRDGTFCRGHLFMRISKRL